MLITTNKSQHVHKHIYANSFLPSTISAWNSLPSSAKTADSLTSFKRFIELETPKIPAYYNTGRRQLQILQTRLRTECSSLNEHLFLGNLVPSPNCTWGVMKNNNHYLLTCPKYDNMRTDMLTVVQQILPANILITSVILLFGINGFEMIGTPKSSKLCKNAKIYRRNKKIHTLNFFLISHTLILIAQIVFLRNYLPMNDLTLSV